MADANAAPAPPRPLRILEIGGRFFLIGAPEGTDCYTAGPRPDAYAPFLGPIRLLRLLLALRRGAYDLLVIHPAQSAPWAPRTLRTALVRARLKAPLALFAGFARRLICRFHNVPIATLDIADSFGIRRHNFRLLDVSRVYFKRELPVDRWRVFFRSGHWDLPGRRWRAKETPQQRLAKLKPIGIGLVPPPPTPPVGKTTDIFFAGEVSPNSTVRSDGIAELKALAAEGYAIDVPDGRLAPDEFRARMAAACLAWSPEGYGWDCFRHYEAAALGTVPLINYPTILRHAPLRDGETCVLYAPEPGGLADAARRALADKPRLAAMGEAARQHTLAHNTYRALSDYVTATVLGRHLDGSAADTPPAP